MTTELYKKYRPKKLRSFFGNTTTSKTITNMLERKKLPHTLLLHGPSGCGKTTLARILKKELSCSDMDFKELNCSDSRGVDTIREIARTMNMAPTGGPCRIWLLDEVHQMTKDAQNAALKILEDTPKHVYFILCTTDPQKIIATIKTRCCQLPVERLNNIDMQKLINKILKREKEALSSDLILDVIEAADGSSRKALVILDSILNLPTEEREEAIKEDHQDKEVIDLCRALVKRETWGKITKILKEIKVEPEAVRYAVLGYARSCLLRKPDNHIAEIIDIFSSNFYDSKQAGLCLACYEAVVGLE